MASLDFPTSPTNGQTYALNGVTYYYNSTVGAWLTQITSSNLATSSNSQVLFSDGGLANGSSGLVFNKAANTLTANNIVATNNVTVTGNLTMTGSITLATMPFYESSANINFNYTINTGMNAFTPGPVAIANGVFVTIPSGSFWSVT